MSKAIFCILPNQDATLRVVDDLKASGFTSNDISVLMPDKSGSRDFAHEHGTKAPEGALAGAGAGGALGGTLGWLVGIGSLAIPGAGPFIAAGPIMAALGGVALGAAVGGITGSLVGLGIPEFQAKQYEGKVKSGNVLVSVHSDDAAQTKLAKDIFERHRAQDISVTEEATVKKEKRVGA